MSSWYFNSYSSSYSYIKWSYIHFTSEVGKILDKDATHAATTGNYVQISAVYAFPSPLTLYEPNA